LALSRRCQCDEREWESGSKARLRYHSQIGVLTPDHPPPYSEAERGLHDSGDGGTGTSGVPIVEALLEHAARVRVLARDPERAAQLLGDQVEIARGDLSDPASIEAAMEGVDRALLNSAPDQNIVKLQSNFIDAAQRAGVEYVVKFSAVAADSNSKRAFLRWHGQAEDAQLRRRSLPDDVSIERIHGEPPGSMVKRMPA
jgi:hypothetical protein